MLHIEKNNYASTYREIFLHDLSLNFLFSKEFSALTVMASQGKGKLADENLEDELLLCVNKQCQVFSNLILQ